MSTSSTRTHEAGTGRLVIRPSGRRYLRWVRAGILRAGLLVAALVAVGMFRSQATLIERLIVFVAIPAGFLAIIVGATYLWIHRAHVVVTPTEIGKAGVLARAKMRARSDIGTVLLATTLDQGDAPGRRYKNLFILDHTGRQIMRLRDVFWETQDIERLVERLGITPVESEGVVSTRQLLKDHPNAARGLERHPFLYVGLIVVGFFGVIFVVVFLVMGVKAIIDAVG